jgi:hypothetical protein
LASSDEDETCNEEKFFHNAYGRKSHKIINLSNGFVRCTYTSSLPNPAALCKTQLPGALFQAIVNMSHMNRFN